MALGWLMATVSSLDILVALVQASSTLLAFFLSSVRWRHCRQL
ncbi:hypothetical protein [Mesorhizobium sp.]|nr:hypothetical protein [Mesorhizobium sp.]